MTRERFEQLRNQFIKEENNITQTKGMDYTKSSEDVLTNFKEGNMLGLNPQQVCGMFLKKHIDSIYNYIKTNGKSQSEPIAERIKDARNYLLFLGALIEEENNISEKYHRDN
jgi:hypothetical protein